MTSDTSRFEGMRCNIPTIASNDFWTLCNGVPVWTFQSTNGSWIKHSAMFGMMWTSFSLALTREVDCKLTRRFESNPEEGWSRILNTFLVAAGTDCLSHQLAPKRCEGLTGTNGYPE
jgi:hypothetical protein